LLYGWSYDFASCINEKSRGTLPCIRSASENQNHAAA
jgi:hypothetical protein